MYSPEAVSAPPGELILGTGKWTIIYKLSKTRERRTRDLADSAYIKDSNVTILTDTDEIKGRWKYSFETLLNVENEREELQPTDAVQGPIPSVNYTEIRKQLSKM